MALRFTLSNRVARLLSCFPAFMRERLLGELSQRLLGPLPRLPVQNQTGLEVGVLRLSSGFEVSYRLDRSLRSVEMLDLSGEGSFATGPTAV
jgi:hypothetical protein